MARDGVSLPALQHLMGHARFAPPCSTSNSHRTTSGGNITAPSKNEAKGTRNRTNVSSLCPHRTDFRSSHPNSRLNPAAWQRVRLSPGCPSLPLLPPGPLSAPASSPPTPPRSPFARMVPIPVVPIPVRTTTAFGPSYPSASAVLCVSPAGRSGRSCGRSHPPVELSAVTPLAAPAAFPARRSTAAAAIAPYR